MDSELRIRVESKGTYASTRIVNADNEEKMPWVRDLKIEFTKEGVFAQMECFDMEERQEGKPRKVRMHGNLETGRTLATFTQKAEVVSIKMTNESQ